MTPIQTNKPVFFDDEGNVLEGGQIYIGQPSTDPRTNPKTVTFRDSGGSEFTASQPLKTVAGRISYNGKPIVALVDGEYSMLILDAAGKQLDYSRSINAAGTEGGGGIADFSEVTRVGLTLSEVKAFDVAVGDVVENTGQLTATDGLGAIWLSVSPTGTPGDDKNLIDFDNGLQGVRDKSQIYYSQFNPFSPRIVWEGNSDSVNFTSLSENDSGWYIIESFTDNLEVSIYCRDLTSSRVISGTANINGTGDSILTTTAINDGSGNFRLKFVNLDVSTATATVSYRTFQRIYKV